MTFEEFYFTQKVLESLSEKMELPSYEDLYGMASDCYSEFKESVYFYDLIGDHGFQHAVEQYIFQKLGNI
tara:strand:+ start:565 stop:774 length:210 start_codon:yes stop_codon:yes gene_type:complete